MNAPIEHNPVSHPAPEKGGVRSSSAKLNPVSHPAKLNPENGLQIGLFQFSGCETEMRNCETTPSQGQFRTPRPPFRGGGCETSFAGAGETDSKPLTLDEAVEAVANARVLVNREFARLVHRYDQPDAAYRVERALVRYVAGTYLPLVQQLRTFPMSDVIARRDALEARLERGYQVPGKQADELFDELLPEYEALSDAIMPDALSPIMERIGRVTT